MVACEIAGCWGQFIEYMKGRCSDTAFRNWLDPIVVIDEDIELVTLEVPNIFVQDYLLSNYKSELCSFLPVRSSGEPAIEFVIAAPKKREAVAPTISSSSPVSVEPKYVMKLNDFYIFDNFIEGPANQFVKSAALGVANNPSKSYNPLFMHGGVGLGKTHLLHAIGHK